MFLGSLLPFGEALISSHLLNRMPVKGMVRVHPVLEGVITRELECLGCQCVSWPCE